MPWGIKVLLRVFVSFHAMLSCALRRFPLRTCERGSTRPFSTISHQKPYLPLYVLPTESLEPYMMPEIPKMAPLPTSTTARQCKRYRLPSVMMRSGTSKGLFLHRHDLPSSVSEWSPILLSAMGSKDSDLRQLNGVGGATSTTSKVCIVSKSDRPGVDVEYTFVQVAVGKSAIDLTGNCGNMCSGVAAFALDEELVVAEPGQTEVSTVV